MNNQRDYNYYEAHEADVTLEEITSCERNKRILRWLRGGRDKDMDISFPYQIRLYLGNINGSCFIDFALSECNDLGWLGYFIGKSKRHFQLSIIGSPETQGGEQRIIHALCDGITRNQSICKISLSNLSNDGFVTIARVLGNLTQLKRLAVSNCVDNDNTLVTLLESGVKLKKLSLHNGVATFAHGLRSIGSSLEELDLSGNNVGNDGLLVLAAALADCTSIKTLYLYDNDLSMAAAGLGALSGWLQTSGIQLQALNLYRCGINDEGLQALIEGAVNHCSYLNLASNRRITASGLRFLSTALQSERCYVENLDITDTAIDDDAAELFARALVGNRTLRSLYLAGGEDEEYDMPITPAGWSAFSIALCDTSSVNNTYLSHHTISELWNIYIDDEDEPQNLTRYLRLNQRYPQHAAKCKILMSHAHLDMTPLLKWELKFLPLAVNWFERAKPCTALSFGQNRILEESDEVFESRILTALYDFVRGAPKKVLERRDELTLVAAYDDKIALVELEKKRLHDEVEKLRREIVQLDKGNMRLRGIVESVKKTVDSY